LVRTNGQQDDDSISIFLPFGQVMFGLQDIEDIHGCNPDIRVLDRPIPLQQTHNVLQAIEPNGHQPFVSNDVLPYSGEQLMGECNNVGGGQPLTEIFK
jgi:hypothetical protein